MNEYSFGSFRLNAKERRLEKSGVPLQLRSRALDILIVLVERAGEVVPKKELLNRVWPDIHVDESSLRVHIAGLRKALGEGEEGARFVSNIPGRGYCFVAGVEAAGERSAPIAQPAVAEQNHGLPPRLSRMIGRDEIVRTISDHLMDRRFMTILGPGGIGKTTVAVSVAHSQLALFDGAVCFFDIGPLQDPELVPGALASRLGLIVQDTDATPAVLRFLRDRKLLLIFDSCEHVVATVAAIAERIFAEAPQVHILATSREALRVEGEHVYRLSALDSPPEKPELTAVEALAFPSVQLFAERASANANGFRLADADAPLVADICRKLDGIALAIELAAGRISAHGIAEIAELLSRRFELLWPGRRTALPRHQTLRATLDWSYHLLTEPERLVLRRLSVFVGFFTLEAAQEVIADDVIVRDEVIGVVAELVTKSLVSVRSNEARTRYRLLDTTRAYAQEKLLESEESDSIAARHARFYRDFLERGGADRTLQGNASPNWSEHLGNVRAALEWTFAQGDAQLAASLAAAATHLFLDLSLLSECYGWSERALTMLTDDMRGTSSEMTLEAALAVSLMFTKGNSEQVRGAYTRSLEIAEKRGDKLNQLRVLGRLHIFHERGGDFHTALEFARRGYELAMDIGDPVGIGAAHSMLGISYHLMGDQSVARSHLETALAQPSSSPRIPAMYFGFHYRNRARIALARTLWLQGQPDRAALVAEETVSEAATIGHPVTLCIALIWAVTTFHWIGDLQRAEESIDRFIAHANRHSLAPYYAVGLGVKGELAVKRGDVEAGMGMLRQSLETLHADRYELLTTAFNSTLAEGLAKAGQVSEALALIDHTVELVERNGDLFYLPELLRMKGVFLDSLSMPDAVGCLNRSLELARGQSSPGWELRTAISLAQVQPARPRKRPDAVLSQIYSRFTEGFETADLRAARQLLEQAG